MTAREVLDGIKDGLYAVTTGPWQHEPWGGQNQNGDYSGGYIIDGHGEWLLSDVSDKDGAFIAAAPSTVARLTAALEAVLELHEQGPGYHVSDVACMACSTAEGYSLWPCPTVAAIETALTD